ncbi:MAG TPA: hypothetical protein VFA88_04655 [Gaiellaceae bacterium]|nr:hypothetical protein [Gaiellaceae bacterium]
MSSTTQVANIPQVDEATIEDGEVRGEIERAAVSKRPPPQWHRTIGENPEAARTFRSY